MKTQLILTASFALLPIASALAGGPEGGSPPVTIEVLDVECLDPEEPNDSALVTFRAETSLTDIYDWQWSFGDGQTSLQEDPTHAYAYTGSFTVSLTIHSYSIGQYTVTEPDLVQINDLLLADDFDDPAFTAGAWHYFRSELLPGTELEFELVKSETDPVGQPLGGQTNGDIICLGPGGGRPFDLGGESSGQFRFMLDLTDAGTEDVSFKAFRLIDDSGPAAPLVVAELRLRQVPGRFEAQIAGFTDQSEWIRLNSGITETRLQVELDWYPAGPYGVTLEARIADLEEVGQPIHALTLTEQVPYPLHFDTLLLGVIELPVNSTQSAGWMQVDDFRACRFEHR